MDNDLNKRVEQFNRLELPGQPRFMHLGTDYLVNDLWSEVQKLRKHIKEMQNPKEMIKMEWYTRNEIINFLKIEGKYNYMSDNEVNFFVKTVQKAYEKGRERGSRGERMSYVPKEKPDFFL